MTVMMHMISAYFKSMFWKTIIVIVAAPAVNIVRYMPVAAAMGAGKSSCTRMG